MIIIEEDRIRDVLVNDQKDLKDQEEVVNWIEDDERIEQKEDFVEKVPYEEDNYKGYRVNIEDKMNVDNHNSEKIKRIDHIFYLDMKENLENRIKEVDSYDEVSDKDIEKVLENNLENDEEN